MLILTFSPFFSSFLLWRKSNNPFNCSVSSEDGNKMKTCVAPHWSYFLPQSNTFPLTILLSFLTKPRCIKVHVFSALGLPLNSFLKDKKRILNLHLLFLYFSSTFSFYISFQKLLTTAVAMLFFFFTYSLRIQAVYKVVVATAVIAIIIIKWNIRAN